MKWEPKGAGQQTTTPSMKMKDNGRGEIAQSKITLCESCQFSGIFQLLLVSLQHKCIYNCGLCGKKVVFESLLFSNQTIISEKSWVRRNNKKRCTNKRAIWGKCIGKQVPFVIASKVGKRRSTLWSQWFDNGSSKRTSENRHLLASKCQIRAPLWSKENPAWENQLRVLYAPQKQQMVLNVISNPRLCVSSCWDRWDRECQNQPIVLHVRSDRSVLIIKSFQCLECWN